jgi:hypothetical protein
MHDVGLNRKRVGITLGCQLVVDKQVVWHAIHVQQQSAIAVAGLNIALQPNGGSFGKQFVHELACLGAKALHRLGGVFRFGCVYANKSYRFGLATNAYLYGVAVNDLFDSCAARIERCCGCTRRGDQTPANEPQLFPHTAMCTTAVIVCVVRSRAPAFAACAFLQANDPARLPSAPCIEQLRGGEE